MRKIWLIIAVLAVVFSPALAWQSGPESLTVISGKGQAASGIYTNYSYFGEAVSGIVSGSIGSMGVGMGAALFSPVLHQAATQAAISSFNGAPICYPNPFNPETESLTIAYKYTQDVDLNVYIYNITGYLLKMLATNSGRTRNSSDGYSRVVWDGSTGFDPSSRVDNGLYLVQIVNNGRVIARIKAMALR
ncbi:hypothetical protein COT42_02135 [Candidatus Saganbacteria bacterium CG08_land_8_20_14_0_20_45_16]|uniref:FlgD Ig-like domain-containing protein n=1 Tax=Candidatus Saganbacteria bacterium CG08_land_8_20_14_0_20_45_16 TaxID=2014293 RepID=A0A2H0Y0D5_UNCSA|nr:MAG: hypothetical protein COT42_02135 [Candidatus Saganbacteria bacterium CG08_land_8_20_14_0_20_45_16]